MQDGVERFEADGWCSGLVIVDAPVLCIAFSHIVNLVMYNFASVIAFPFADQFTLQGTVPSGNF